MDNGFNDRITGSGDDAEVIITIVDQVEAQFRYPLADITFPAGYLADIDVRVLFAFSQPQGLNPSRSSQR